MTEPGKATIDFMLPSGHWPQSMVRVRARFTSAITGAPVKPSVITLRVQPPGETAEIDYVWPSGDTIVDEDEGGWFYADIPLHLSGEWVFRWFGTGTVQAAVEGKRYVPQSSFQETGHPGPTDPGEADLGPAYSIRAVNALGTAMAFLSLAAIIGGVGAVPLGVGGPTITWGTAEPTHEAPNGSPYFRNSGDAATAIYTRQGDAWAVIAGGGGGGGAPSGPAGGALTGTYPNPGINLGHASVSGTLSVDHGGVPAGGVDGQILGNVAGVPTWGSLPSVIPIDLTTEVTGVLAAIRQEDQVLGGNLSGTTGAAVVTHINGGSVPAAGGLTANHLLMVEGPSAYGHGLLSNANVASNAGIDGSKLVPAFVAQNISTTGTLSAGAATLSSALVSGLSGTGVRALTVDATGNLVALALGAAGNTLRVNVGATAVELSALNLAGGPNYITGVLPVGNGGVPAATTNGFVLTLVSSVPTWAAASGGGDPSLGGELSGTASAAVVAKFNGANVPGALGANNTLFGVNGSGALAYSLIVNANVDGSAAISGTKISPDFGAQNIVTTGALSLGATPATGGALNIGNNQAINMRTSGGTIVSVAFVSIAGNLVLGTTSVPTRVQGSNVQVQYSASNFLSWGTTTVEHGRLDANSNLGLGTGAVPAGLTRGIALPSGTGPSSGTASIGAIWFDGTDFKGRRGTNVVQTFVMA